MTTDGFWMCAFTGIIAGTAFLYGFLLGLLTRAKCEPRSPTGEEEDLRDDADWWKNGG